MPRSETILSVFVASPSDVLEERDRLDGIVNEINSTLARRKGVRLELLRWERDASPAFGNDPQAVINDQIPPYDIFICILWHTIGSPTERAESGTIEEFELAKARYDKDQKSVRLMLYFKGAPPLSLADIDPDQYKRVVEFRSRVSEAGGLYSEFTTADDFANQVRIDLTKYLLDWQEDDEKDSQSDGTEVAGVSESRGNGDDDSTDELDDGLLDLEDVIEEEVDALSDVLVKINEAIGYIGGSIDGRAQELQSIQGEGDKKRISAQERRRLRTAARRVLRDASGDMDRFVALMEPELPLFRQHLDKGIDALAKAIPIYLEMNEDRTELKETIGSMWEGMDGMLVSMGGLHDSVHGLPRVETSLIRSRRATEKILQEVIDITRDGKASLEGVLSLLP